METVVFKKIYFFSIMDIFHYAYILTECGKDMYEKYGLTHWKNSFIKNFLIVIIGLFKNQLFIGFISGKYCCAFQIHFLKEGVLFSKLCTLPIFHSRGIGNQCIDYINLKAKQKGKNFLICEVYDQSTHAINFYKKRGFKIISTKKTLKYNELIMKRENK